MFHQICGREVSDCVFTDALFPFWQLSQFKKVKDPANNPFWSTATFLILLFFFPFFSPDNKKGLSRIVQ